MKKIFTILILALIFSISVFAVAVEKLEQTELDKILDIKLGLSDNPLRIGALSISTLYSKYFNESNDRYPFVGAKVEIYIDSIVYANIELSKYLTGESITGRRGHFIDLPHMFSTLDLVYTPIGSIPTSKKLFYKDVKTTKTEFDATKYRQPFKFETNGLPFIIFSQKNDYAVTLRYGCDSTEPNLRFKSLLLSSDKIKLNEGKLAYATFSEPVYNVYLQSLLSVPSLYYSKQEFTNDVTSKVENSHVLTITCTNMEDIKVSHSVTVPIKLGMYHIHE